ncbi:DUF6615 family protein, partial [Bosea vaviloviae]|uniref:DUF6615 family protein n=1 Tax=Bosea vaviloviae TaxID=1526658 RepID=UPI001AEBC43F
MLCRFSRRFPNYLAAILEKGEGLKRNFREETGTDLLTAGLLGLSTFGIYVDYPDEPTTGADMEWVFISPKDVGGGRYLRLLIQAKRARSCGQTGFPKQLMSDSTLLFEEGSGASRVDERRGMGVLRAFPDREPDAGRAAALGPSAGAR